MNEALEVQYVLRKVPLERCDLVTDPISDETGWKAPRGFIFRMLGQFEIDSHQEDIADRYRPQESAGLLIAQNNALYADCLDKARGKSPQERYDKALELMIEELEDYPGEYEAPWTFEGKWLVVKGTQVYVKAERDAWIESGYYFKANKLLGLEDQDSLYFQTPEGRPKWKQYYAKGVTGGSKVEMVPYEEPTPVLYTPDPVEETLITPLPATLCTSDSYFQHWEKIYGRPPSEEQKVAIVRQYRWTGLPFDDDAAKDLILPHQVRKLVFPKSISRKDLREAHATDLPFLPL